MKALFAGMAAVLGLMLVVPDQVDAQDCKLCEMKLCDLGEGPTGCHSFPGGSETPTFECASPKDLEEEPVASGPVMKRDECDQCHEMWIEWLCNWNHDVCWTDDLLLAGLIAEVDQLVSSLSVDVTGESADPASELVTRVLGSANLTVDPSGGTLRLSRCGGPLIASWRVPEAFLERVSGDTH